MVTSTTGTTTWDDPETYQKETWKSYVEGPKWAGFRPFLAKLAFSFGVNLEITERSPTLLRETIFFTVQGNKFQVDRFRKALKESINDLRVYIVEYNK